MSITPDYYMNRYFPVLLELINEIKLTTEIKSLNKYEDFEPLIQKIESTLLQGTFGFNRTELAEIIFYILFNGYLTQYNTPRTQISKINGCAYYNYVSRSGYKIILYSGNCSPALVSRHFLIITKKGIFNLTGFGWYHTAPQTVRTLVNFMYHYIRVSSQ